MMAPAAGLRRRVRPPLIRTGAAPVGTAAIALTGALLTACSAAPSAHDVASSYLADWANRDWPAMRALVARPPASFTAVNAAALTDIGVTRASYVGGPITQNGNSARERVTQQLRLAGARTITVRSVLRLTSASGAWRVAWTPGTVASQLTAGGHLRLQVNWPARAQILGAGGAPLTLEAAMVTIGVEGSLRHK